MFFMFRIFPENFFDKKYQCIFRMFCERSNIGIFFPVNNCSLCLLFSFIVSLLFLFCVTDGFIKALTHTLGLQIGCTQEAILIEISQTVQTYIEIPELIAHLIRTSSY